MTVISLIYHLFWLAITGRCRLSDPVVRHSGDWSKDGSSNYKRIYFINFRQRKLSLPHTDYPDDRDMEDGGATHRTYRKDAAGITVTVVELD